MTVERNVWADNLPSGLKKIISSADFNARFYFATDNKQNIWLANLEKNLLPKNIEDLKQSLNIIQNDRNLELVSFWKANQRANAIYEYDDTIPPKLNELIAKIDSNVKPYDNKEFKSINAWISQCYLSSDLSNKITCFTVCYPINTIARKKRLFFNQDQLKETDIPEFRYTLYPDFFLYNKRLYILNLDKAIKFCDLNELQIKRANDSFENLTKIDCIAFESKKMQSFIEEITSKKRIQKKLVTIPKSILQMFIDHPQLMINNMKKIEQYKSTLSFDSENVITIKNKKQFSGLLRALNDEILISKLTDIIYDVSVKDEVNLRT